MPEKLEINGKEYLKRTLETLSGVKNFFDIDGNLLLIGEAIDNPYDFPFLLEDIYDMDFDDDLRLALVRIQIDSKLHMRRDLEHEQLRLFVAEAIEKMLFGDLLMDGNGIGREKDDEKDKKKSKTKSGAKASSSVKAKKGKSSGGGEKGKNKGGSLGKGKGKGKEDDKESDERKEKNSDDADDYSYAKFQNELIKS